NRCRALLEYSDFVDIIKRERKNKVPIGAAVEKALDHAIKQKCLGDYFSSCKEEVMNMSLTEFDQESFERQIRAEGISIGLEKGKNEAKLETARKMIQEKLPKELVLKITEITDKTYANILEEALGTISTNAQ
ncbi:MAG: hypothetical protein KBT11_05755, partial [Treponema sp.]|nr:hypothetical protein [Candidatus Treponema equifaecale]